MSCASQGGFRVVMLALVVLVPQFVAAQSAAGSKPEAADVAEPSPAEQQAQLQNYVSVLESELERAEARARAVTVQLVALDDDIESRVNRIVSLLSSVRDSTDTSSTRMRKAKEDALKGLKATALQYAQERDRRKRELAAPNARIDDDILARDIAALNARIETRITQSLDIAESLVQHAEGTVERHRNEDTDYGVETPEYQKAQRDTHASARIKADLAADIHASIEKLTRDKKAREAELAATANPQTQAQLTEEIATLRQTIEARRNQLEELVAAKPSATRPVSTKGAFEMDKMIDEMTAELRREFAKVRSLVMERDAAQARVKPLKERLEKASAMLKATAAGGQ